MALWLLIALQEHPWKDFPEGASVTRRTTVEQDGRVLSREEVKWIRGSIDGDQLRLRTVRGDLEGEEILPLQAPADRFRDVKLESPARAKLRIGSASFDCTVEAGSAKTDEGDWTFRVWSSAKAEIPPIVARESGFLPPAQATVRLLKFEGTHGEDFAKYSVLSLDRKVKIGGTEVVAVEVRMERRIEKTRLEKVEALLSKAVPGHVVKIVTTLTSERMPAMKTTVETVECSPK